MMCQDSRHHIKRKQTLNTSTWKEDTTIIANYSMYITVCILHICSSLTGIICVTKKKKEREIDAKLSEFSFRVWLKGSLKDTIVFYLAKCSDLPQHQQNQGVVKSRERDTPSKREAWLCK